MSKEQLYEQMVEDLDSRVQQDSKAFAEDVRGRVLDRIKRNEQGESGLEPYVSDVKQKRDSRGSFTGEWTFEIQHPTAPLHEKGGHIEPSYANAQVRGWTRDQFYEALEDCNEWVEKKRIVRSAMLQTMKDYE